MGDVSDTFVCAVCEFWAFGTLCPFELLCVVRALGSIEKGRSKTPLLILLLLLIDVQCLLIMNVDLILCLCWMCSTLRWHLLIWLDPLAGAQALSFSTDPQLHLPHTVTICLRRAVE